MNKMPNPGQIKHPCSDCSYYEKSVWKSLENGSVKLLSRKLARREMAEGDVLFRQGSKNRGVFCVSKGLFSLRTLHVDGASTFLRLAYPGKIIGFRAFLRNGEHQTEARALMPSRVCTVARRDANRLIDTSPSVLSQLIEYCIEEIDASQKRIVASAVSSNKERLIDLLLTLCRDHGEQSENTVHMQLPLSRQDLADILGVQPETLSRLLRRLENDGFLSVSGRSIIVTIPKERHDTSRAIK